MRMAAETPAGRDDGWLARWPWAAVALLMLVGILNILDRTLPQILAQPIKEELKLSDTALGVINGLGFLVIYAAGSIPIAHLSDRGHYKKVISFTLALWSAMTLLGGWVTAGWQLALSRMGVSIGEAGATPSAHAYITRHFPPDRRAIALSTYMVCVPLGSMGGFALGGFLGQELGWRGAFMVMGGVGLVLSLLAVFALGLRPRAVAARSDATPHTPFLPLFRKRSLLLMLAGISFIQIGGYAETAFIPAFLMRSHRMTVGEAGLNFGLIGAGGGVVGLIFLGWLADRLSRRDVRWSLGVVVVMIALLLPIAYLSFGITDTRTAVWAVAANHIIPVAYSGPVIAALHRLCEVDLRARASALLLLCAGVVGWTGPLLVGMISDALTATYGPHALGHALQVVVPACFLLSGISYALAIIDYRKEVVEE
jgi:predicted MFS family arabinose efflux permease